MSFEEKDEVKTDNPSVSSDEMDWDAYAEHYDEMCALNPAYQNNIELLLKRIPIWNMPANAKVCDLGAGTGNYICSLSALLPEADFVHVDFDTKMNELASQKYSRLEKPNVQIIQEYAQRIEFPNQSFDLVMCVNALYAISPQLEVLQKIRSWIKPGGRLFIIDFGRKQRTLEWTLYILRESLKSNTLGRYAKTLIEAREVLKQNRRSTKGQITGRYWLHSTNQFGETLRQCGFLVEELFPCYRGYADLAVCRVSE